ncbi:MAG: hypothetical protein ABL949_09710 [Fimbriimonadaceae bacterium]
MIPFCEWLETRYSGGGPTHDDHFETRATYAEYVVLTWERPTEFLTTRFTLDQIGEVMMRERHVYGSAQLPRELRNRAWRALSPLCGELFAPNVSDSLSHRNESAKGTARLDGACYMWWDVSPFYPGNRSMTPVDSAFFVSICRECLASPKAAIQESAIHGLGHAVGISEPLIEARTALDDYIREANFARPELLQYAKRARKGRVQ